MNIWQPVTAGLWSASFPLNGWENRSTALRLRDSTLAVYNPYSRIAADQLAELQGIGRISTLIAPNHYHHLGLKPWLAQLGPLRLIASATATSRLVQQTALRFDRPESLAELLPAGGAIWCPPGTRNGELWLELQDGAQRIWVVGDAFFNVARAPKGLAGLLLRLTASVPGLRVGRTFGWLGLRDNWAYAEWLHAALRDEPPTQLIPCHGDVATGSDLAARMSTAAFGAYE